MTKTDIVVSTQVVTDFHPAATPVAFLPSPPSSLAEGDGDDDGDLATKTYFTTATYFTTLIDGSRTLTRTRTRIRSSVVTEPAAQSASFSTAEASSFIKPSKVVSEVPKR